MEETLSLQEIAKIIKKYLLVIIMFSFISAGISIVINVYALTPIYQAQTQILVNQKNISEEVPVWQRTEADLGLIKTYNTIITSPVILTPVIEKLNLTLTPANLTEQIFVSNENDSKVVNIRIEDADPSKAVEISNTIAEEFKEQIPKLMNIDNISILSKAQLSNKPTPIKPNKILNIMIGGAIGFILGICLAFLLELFDNSIKSESDAEAYLNLPVIGIVDVIVEEKKKRFFNSRKTWRT